MLGAHDVGYRRLGNLGFLHESLDGPVLKLAVEIAWHTQDNWTELTASVSTMAGWCGKSERWVRKYLPKVVAAGLLSIVEPPRQGRSGRYSILVTPSRHKMDIAPTARSSTDQPRARQPATPHQRVEDYALAERQGISEEEEEATSLTDAAVRDPDRIRAAIGRRENESMTEYLERRAGALPDPHDAA